MKKFYEIYFKLRGYVKASRFTAGLISLVWLIAFVFAIKTSVLDANNIPSPSMEPTLMIGDFLFVNKMRYTIDLPYTNIHLLRIAYPERGDIVTFTPPQDSASYVNKTLVKRVVGVPGDTIEVNNHEITVSGVKYPTTRAENAALLKTLQNGHTADVENLYTEDVVDPTTKKLYVRHYIMKSKRGSETVMSSPGRKWVIPPHKYLMMGDNRDHSWDGRACEMVESKYRRACGEFNNCQADVITNYKTEQQCILIYSQNEGETWGLIDADKIHGKVYMSYLSVNWGTGTNSELNPIVNLFKTITGEFTGVYVRWERTFSRIY
ncbi:MAG TPA: signal peptidase I [Turneriella sp.]|nr:signal peptidase I [Turneriella sp.]